MCQVSNRNELPNNLVLSDKYNACVDVTLIFNFDGFKWSVKIGTQDRFQKFEFGHVPIESKYFGDFEVSWNPMLSSV